MNAKLLRLSLGDGYGGSHTGALLLTEYSASRGVETLLVVSKGSLTERRAQEKGLRFVAIDDDASDRELFDFLKAEIERFAPALLVAHHSRERKLSLRLKRKLGDRFINVAHRHNISKTAPLVGPFLYNRYCDYHIAVHESVKRSLTDAGIREERVKVVRNGVPFPDDLDDISGDDLRHELGLGDAFVVGMSAWFHEKRKGFDLAMRAFAKLQGDVRLLLLGPDERHRDDLRRLADEAGADWSRVIAPGFVRDVWSGYKAMDVFLFPSRSEGFGRSWVEASAAAVPVVAANIPPCAENAIHDGVDGLLVEVEDVEGYVAAIERIRNDRAFAERLGAAAKKNAFENFSIERFGADFMRFLEEILSERGVA